METGKFSVVYKDSEGVEHTVQVDRDNITAPVGTVIQSQAKYSEIIETEKRKAGESARKDLVSPAENRAALLDDTSFFQEMATKRGMKISADGKVSGELAPERLQEYQDAWKKEYLEPALSERDTLKKAIEVGRSDVLLRDIQTAALEAGVKPGLLKNPLNPGQPGMFVRELASAASWNDENKRYEFRDAHGLSMLNGNGEAVTVKDRIESIRQSDTDFQYFGDQRPTSTSPGSLNPQAADPNRRRLSVTRMQEMQQTNPAEHDRIMAEQGEAAEWVD